MKKMIALACLGFAFTVSAPAFAAGEKMKGCSKEATGMKGDERKAFMKKCLSKDYVLKHDAMAGAPAAATPATPAAPAASSAQQDKMKACNADAKARGLKDDERKKFMGACLKG
ncbi:MAG: PsiF repeat-containing protein [Nitrosomonadales bacterium]|nr:PsiF repeat-containing protein [Nitrosomonadales bacterium]OGT02775.1 MAG: PsiF repeat-containing protein [Gallionellales bacterium RIFCSPLOWO2_02_60_31]